MRRLSSVRVPAGRIEAAGGTSGPSRALQSRPTSGRGMDVDPVEPPSAREQSLCEGDVHEEEAAGVNARGLDDSPHLELHPAVAGDDGKRVAGKDTERSGHPDRPAIDHLGHPGPRQAAHLPQRRIPDQIDSEQRDLLAGSGQEREALDARREGERLLETHEIAVCRFRNAADLGDLVARGPLKRLEGRLERPHRGFAREVHGHDDRDPEGDGGYREQRTRPVPDHGRTMRRKRRTARATVVYTPSGTRTSAAASFPSRRIRRRSDAAAISRLWVAMRMLVPSCRFHVEEQLHDRLGRVVVEAPGRLVGEQQTRLVHQCPRDGDPLHLAPRQLVRLAAGELRDTTRSSISTARPRDFRTPASWSGSSTFSTALRVGSNCRN